MRAIMIGRFHKMHGLGNDFVVIDARETPLEISTERARAIADRRTGIGCDQLILLERSTAADARMRTFNPDGGEVQICGNATRAVALLIGKPAQLETLGGLIDIVPQGGGATVSMGMPRFGWDEIPLAYAIDTASMPVAWEDLTDPAAVNIGNPHVVFFVANCDAIDLERIGPLIEHDPLFPERINVNIATVTGHNALRLRVWGARRGDHARVRNGRLRDRGRRDPQQACVEPCCRNAARRHADNRMVARGVDPDDRPSHACVHG